MSSAGNTLIGLTILFSLAIGVGCDSSKSNPTTVDGRVRGTKGNSAEVCVNPIKVDVAKGETAIKLEDMITGQPGALELVKGTLFVKMVNSKDGDTNYLHGESVGFQTPTQGQVTETRAGGNIICTTAKEVTETESSRNETPDGGVETNSTTTNEKVRINGNFDFPNAIDSESGDVTHYRKDEFTADGQDRKTTSTLYEKLINFREKAGEMEDLPSNVEFVAVQKSDTEFVIRMKADIRDGDIDSEISMSALYRLKK